MTTNKNITIIPTGGLCNRMRAMSSGYYLTRQDRATANILWNKNSGLNANFDDLFEPLNLPDIAVNRNQNWLFRIERTRDYIIRQMILKLRYQTIYNFSINNQKGDITNVIDKKDRRQLLLISCYSMCTHYPIKELFVPRADIQQRIDGITNSFSANTIGVHIRRTDNAESIRRSPLTSFINILKEEVGKDESVKFYLASDDEEVKQTLNEQFPNHIITCQDKVNRNSLEGMRFAVIDLFCLSKTKKIIGSDYSSYSQIAAEIGGIPLEYARK